ncbi:MAG: Spo0E family sporulation regulatory protein-aspartic acid phosphatase [Bacilli bacterium]
MPNHRCGSPPDRDSLPEDTFHNVQRMAVLRRLMEDLFNKNYSLHDPLMISLSAELDELVVLEMRKRSRATKSSR